MKTQRPAAVPRQVKKQQSQKAFGLRFLSFNPPFFSTFFQILLLAVFVAVTVAHWKVCWILFENLRWWSTRNLLQKETSLFSEQAMYYRYFKKGVNIPSISEVMNFFTHDDRVQHPEVINALKQFNVYPELFLSLFYRSFSPALLGLPIDFYVNSVHFFNGFYLGAIFLFGVILSRNIYGGLFSVFCFMMNHGHNTRAWWSISLRESIAMPFFACQVVVLGYYLRIAYDKAKKERSEEEKQKNTDKKGKEDSTESDEVDDSFFSSADTRLFNEKVFLILFGYFTLIFTLCWQFAGFTLLTQAVSIFCVFLLEFISKQTAQKVLVVSGISVGIAALMQFGNQMLVNSLYFNFLIVSLLILQIPRRFLIGSEDSYHLIKLIRALIVVVLSGASGVALKLGTAKLVGIEDDGHIFDILRAKFTSFSTFDTILYLKQKEYQMIDEETYTELAQSLLVPVAVFLVVVVGLKLLFNKFHLRDPFVVYSALQYIAFTALAVLIMRLKVFWTPFNCMFAAWIFSHEVRSMWYWLCDKISGKMDNWKKVISFLFIFAIICAVMANHGVPKLHRGLTDEKEWNHEPLQNFMTWVQKNTHVDDVFAGDMTILSNIMLVTDRKVTNHPHYESVEIRQKTKEIYSLFSCKKPKEVYQIMKKYNVSYVDVSPGSCSKSQLYGSDCAGAETFCSQIKSATNYFTFAFESHNTYIIYKVK